jgi:hypothetical protein
MGQPMYSGMDGSATPTTPARGAAPGSFRGRMAPNMGPRGRGRGRGRGGLYTGGDGTLTFRRSAELVFT